VAHRRDSDPFFLEVHRHIGWQPELLSNDVIFNSRRPIAPGLAVPCPWHAALYGAIHWQIHHYGFELGLERIVDGLEVAQFLRRQDVDWEALAQHVAGAGIGRKVDAALAVAVELFAAQAPKQLLPTGDGRAYVAHVLELRESRPLRQKAKQQQRVLRLWDD